MQQDASNAKQLIVERIRQSTNILVAVSASPSVDSLAAALGLALMLNKMDKHATAVFSGTLPPAIEFLEPGKTFENSVDSLRDFIISLDKEKADRLRYKVEDDVVRIFITPYRTIINENDLQFSQGDFNVDLILALGVEKRDDLDKAIVAHGRILHDATVMTINANNQQSTLGAVDWHDQSASSLSEMLVGLVEALAQPNLLDQQTATALLTGIVAATDRFSNQNTTPRVMTMAAQLMAAGANQQLIANNLVKAHELPQVPNNGQLVPDGPSVKVAVEQPKPNGELDISHPKKEEPAAQSGQQPQQQPRPEKQRGKKGKQRSAEDELAAALPATTAPQNDFEQLKAAIKEDVAAGGQSPLESVKAPGSQTVNGASVSEEDTPKEDNSYVVGNGSWRGRRLEPPTLGGTLNATTEQAMDDTKKAEERDRNQKLLTHPDSPQKNKAKTVEPPARQEDLSAKAEQASIKDQPEQPKKAKDEPAPAVVPAPPVEAIEAPAPPTQLAAAEKTEAPTAAPLPEPVAPAPAPELVAAPPIPAPEPAPLPEPPAPPQEPPAPALPPEPAPTAVPAAPPANLDEARKAVDDALATQPFNPAGQPLESVGAMPLEATPPPAESPTLPPLPDAAQAAAPAPLPPAPALPGLESLPPLPPMPPLPQQDSTQPLPPPPSISDLPPLPSNIPAAPVAPPQAVLPQEPAAPQAPADPKQFQIPS